jgi:hypothetical protein
VSAADRASPPWARDFVHHMAMLSQRERDQWEAKLVTYFTELRLGTADACRHVRTPTGLCAACGDAS